MKGVRIASLVLLTVVVLQTFVVYSVLGDDADPTLETDKPYYPIGGTVKFSGSGYDSSLTYGINVSYVEDDLLVESLEPFTPKDSAIPTGVSWVIPFDAKNGTYLAEAYEIGSQDVIAFTEFQVLNATEALKVLEGNLTDLKDLVISEVEVMGINNSLLASLNNSIRKLEAAMALFEGGENNKTAANQMRAARNMLTAFVHKVLAQAGKKIDEETARYLVGNASAYIEYIDSMIVSTLVPLGKKLALNVEKTLAKQEAHLTKFIMKKGMDEATTDEELLSLLNSTEAALTEALGRSKGKMQLLQSLLDSGAINYTDLIMQLEESNDSVNLVKAMAQLLSEELEELNLTRPGLGAHLGQLKKAAKELVDESEDVGKSHGELTSEANRHGPKEDHGKGHNDEDDDGGGIDDGGNDHGGGGGNDHGGGGGNDHGGGGGKDKDKGKE